ncbi:hypothetical protein [Mycobacterium sp.]|uniref:hypothetical protein n=1 Tax=Mycobacterium sp. TaxID=1785 RepID=UPI002B594571|nr:hypothetical protein [Mycobacterium sp.]HTY31291.1 hypothetical protein [Mycobacterium sp.]
MDRPDVFFSAFARRPRPAAADLLDAVNGHPERERARDVLSARQSSELSVAELRDIVGGNLGLLKPEAFLYFLPAFLAAITADYPALTVLTSELLGQLTPPARDNVAARFERLRRNNRASGAGLPEETVEILRSQALQLIDSGILARRFAARFDGIAPEEAHAILAFLHHLRERYGEDFPSGALDAAITYWEGQHAPGDTSP